MSETTRQLSAVEWNEAEARLNRLGLDPAVFLHNEALYGLCDEREHYEYLMLATDDEIRDWAESFRR